MKNRYDRKILSKKKEIIKRAYSKNVNFPGKILSDYKKIKLQVKLKFFSFFTSLI